MGRTLIDVDGQRFGRLVASNKVKKIGRAMCRLCYCDCGKKTWQATKGYTKKNCVSCCKICNRAKSGMGFDDFMSWIRRLQA